MQQDQDDQDDRQKDLQGAEDDLHAAEGSGGILLILGLLTRLAALALTIDLIVAIVLVKLKVGLIAQMAAGAELDLAYIAAFLALLLMGRERLPSIA